MKPALFHQRLAKLSDLSSPGLLTKGLKGLEKESLRITRQARIAQTPHPGCLGSALAHPHITTDYSEALLEFITPPRADPDAVVAFLDDIHRFVYHCLNDDELLLATSMPIGFDRDEDIPIARYGSSNIGRMKYIYRLGLAHRYGRAMQAIAGIHFNFSVALELWPRLIQILDLDEPMPAARDSAYFALIRNVQRHGWLLLYLFGASPVVDRSFLQCRGGVPAEFKELAPESYGLPYATSLRMSDIGYRNPTQAGLFISTNSLDEYVTSLCRAIETPYPRYQAIGVKVNGQYRQLNANLLQIENEYYSPVRPKQITERGEKPTLALRRRGVRYVEIRSIDLNPYLPIGIDTDQIRFLELFLWHCLLYPSPPLPRHLSRISQTNLLAVAQQGRDPKLTLRRDGETIGLRDWAESLFEEMTPLCRLLDIPLAGTPYQDALMAQQR
ncbi:MAG TPA: glutamate--cysteine ligase, partial [Methylothermaceae bacterium]|nr:glutamate--cysteine ligase [Methylothermaceae bacterium]